MQTLKSDLVVRSVGIYTWQLVEPFYFYFNEDNKEDGVIIPEGFITDFASVPKSLWSIVPPIGLYTKAAVMHDYLYKNGYAEKYDRKFCDQMFLEAMRALGVGGITRRAMYYGVRLWGGKYFNLK